METNNQMNFIITENEDTANQLQENGLRLVQTLGNSWLFLNDQNKMMFAKDKNLKFTYTNKMMF